ncbi:MAG TPA: GDSL-type esterase/lipase family protein [Fimbriimonas sp.]
MSLLPLLLTVAMQAPSAYRIGDRAYFDASLPRLQYFGRIGMEDPSAPSFHYGGSGFKVKFEGTSIALAFEEDDWGRGNWLGFRIDGSPEIRQYLEPKSDALYQIAVGLEDTEHEMLVYRRSDAVDGMFRFKGVAIDPGKRLGWPSRRPRKRIEFFGDSVTSGVHAEAVGYEGKEDDEIGTNNLREPLVNTYWSYASMAARMLGAEAHVNGIGGLALHDENGWWGGSTLTGLETTYDKLSPIPSRLAPWDFSRWTPHVVVIAIGQNDGRFLDPKSDLDRQRWIGTYLQIVESLRSHYPKAWFVLSTTILIHDPAWDELVREVAHRRRQSGDRRVAFYRYRRAGTGTPGHARLTENREMAAELTRFIGSLPAVWQNTE